MHSLDKIKRRIKTVQTTSKITGAMKLVATAKIKRQMNQFKVVNSFCTDFYDIIQDIVKTLPPESNMIAKDAKRRKLYVLISSSLGLCGAFNINVCKRLIDVIKPGDEVIVVGRKGYSFLKAHDLIGSVKELLEISDANIDYLELLPTSEAIYQLFKNGEYSSVHVIYTKFINSMTFEPTEVQILPLDKKLFKADGKEERVSLTDDKKEILYEPSKENIVANSIPIYVTTMLYASISESKVCENGARRNAMETATDNARQLIEDLTLQYNRARQESITQEINEIVAGANGSE